ncbi:alpha/beta hydrolase [Sphingobium amiense]|uniref:Alpha/beta hydrolase n=1 Tax=Sphingobium amiense TaxID=135719 RepID=A0A494WG40_9SPHN|nr:alpha/beta hydrolase [Sphingobium amiense]BBD99962.1 alpha/beta hydrolase [Sphingobium amiense]
MIERIVLNGAELAYSTYGVEGGKEALLFVHGYAMRATGPLYGELLTALSKRHAVYALDLRGHGASKDSWANWSFETLADDIVAFVEALRLDQPVFVGHSFGAPVGLFTEIRHPGTFSAFCLLSPGPADHRRDPVDALKFMIENGRSRDVLRPGFDRMFVHRPSASTEATLDAVTLLDSGVHLALQAANPLFSIDDQLKDVAAPALLICGEADTVVPPAIQHDMARKLPRCREVVHAAEGHMLPIESAPVVAGDIAAFLAEFARDPLSS